MVSNTSRHKTVPLFANILVKACRTTNISKDQTMIALQIKGKMITAFKPSKPDRPRTHCLKQNKRMKNRIPCVNDENSQRNICSYCISKTSFLLISPDKAVYVNYRLDALITLTCIGLTPKPRSLKRSWCRLCLGGPLGKGTPKHSSTPRLA